MGRALYDRRKLPRRLRNKYQPGPSALSARLAGPRTLLAPAFVNTCSHLPLRPLKLLACVANKSRATKT